jgi:hypothetical protein
MNGDEKIEENGTNIPNGKKTMVQKLFPHLVDSIEKKKQIQQELADFKEAKQKEMEVFFDKLLAQYREAVEKESEELKRLYNEKLETISKNEEAYRLLYNERTAELEKKLSGEYEKLEAAKDELLLAQKDCSDWRQRLDQEQTELSYAKERLQQREALLNDRENKIDKTIDEAIAAERERLTAYENELKQRDAELDVTVLQKTNAERVRLEGYDAELQQRERSINATVQAETELERTRLAQDRNALNKREADINAAVLRATNTEKTRLEAYATDLQQREVNINATVHAETERERTRLQNRQTELDKREDRLNQTIEEEVTKRLEVRKAALDVLLEDAKKTVIDFTERLKSYHKFEQLYRELSEKLGSDPLVLNKEIEELRTELMQTREELLNRPSKNLEEKYHTLKEKISNIEEREAALADREDEYHTAFNENADLKEKNAALETDCNFYKTEYERLSESYKTPKNREERIASIEMPLEAFARKKLSEEYKTKEAKNELTWLRNITEKTKNFGLVFPERILYAFHTALKCAEISPLTVLAGVSGTGKSELPRLYAHFGGLNFLTLPVQPNWDSQEAMLGFFNSIDNRFDAQDVLRLLVQTQKDETLQKAMTLILLDEMNLANVELYFSDFLSKLESRRGLSDDNVPSIGVKIGSGLEDYAIKLGRNVLWAGTMNQDETTKTLSDKVLDRGIIINFPSPKKLKSRATHELAAPADLLPRSVWKDWVKKDALFVPDVEANAEIVRKYKTIVENINEELGKTGRALGHRVWQSIETYMANYPTIMAQTDEAKRAKELDKAFQDQLVQKVMPKLRGIETRGIQGDCLKRIQEKISDYQLDEDFKNALELGYGQFMWCTSNYIYKDESNAVTETAETAVAPELKDSLATSTQNAAQD